MICEKHRRDTKSEGPDGGYIPVSTLRLALAWWCYAEGLMSLRAVRVVVALYELMTRRVAYSRSEAKQGRKPVFTPHFSTKELGDVLGLPERKARAALKELLDLGFVSEFSETRIAFAPLVEDTTLTDSQRSDFWAWYQSLTKRKRVPIPRRILVLAAESSSPAQIAFILGACLRCIYFDKAKGFAYTGRISSAWVSEHFGVCLRAVKSAKSRLVALGWLEPKGKVSRFGELVAINPYWERLAETTEAERKPRDHGAGGADVPVEGPESAPLPVDFGSKSAPAITRESSFGTEEKYQRESQPPRADNSGPGIFNPETQNKTPQDESGQKLPPPRLSSIRPEDFTDLTRALILFGYAVRCGLMHNDSEHARLLWVAAIERARTVPARNPAGVFLYLVKNKKWGFLSDGHFEAARLRLKAHRDSERTISPPLFVPARVGFSQPSGEGREIAALPALSRDAQVIKTVRGAIAQKGLRVSDLLPHLRRVDASWNRPRLDAALAELDAPRVANYALEEQPERASNVG